MKRALLLFLVPGIAGCGLLGGGRIEGAGAAHVIISQLPGCDVFMTHAYLGNYAVIRLLDRDYTPALGDLLEGITDGTGQQTLLYRPPHAQDVRRESVPVEVIIEEADLELEDAQQAFREACPPAPQPPR